MSAKDDASAEFTKEACQGFRPGEGAIALPYGPSWHLRASTTHKHPDPGESAYPPSAQRPAPSAQNDEQQQPDMYL